MTNLRQSRRAHVAMYPMRIPVPGTQPTRFRDLQCFRGDIADVEALVKQTLEANPGAEIRYEDRQPLTLYVEVVMP